MRLKAKVFVLPIVCLLLAAPLFAHHSFNAEFDANKTVVVTGVLTKVEWINPHCFWWVQGKDQNGNEGLWSIQGFAPSELRIANIRRDMAGQAGDQVTVEAYGTKDGTKLLAFAKTIRFADGRSITMSVRDPTKDVQK